MSAVFLIGFLSALAFAQGGVIHQNEPAFMENIRSASGSRVVGGWAANYGQFPYQVSIRMVNTAGSVSSCGGSIIHNEWVITAAHCVQLRNNFVIRLGSTNLTRPDWILEASRRFIYPTYNENSPFVQPNDIALIGLDTPVAYGPLIQPCRLQQSGSRDEEYPGTVLTVSGYGLNEDSWNGGTTQEHLRWTHLRGITLASCRTFYGSTVVNAATVCAEYYNDTAQSSCQGDSGGPLVIQDLDGKPTMVGVVSFGSSAGCNSIFPSAYVRPDYFHDWYTEVTGINFDWNREDLITSGESGESEEDSEDGDNGVDAPIVAPGFAY